MSDKKLQNLHFSMLEDILPVGMAIFDRAKDGGADKVLEGLFSSDNPIDKLKVEGYASAKLVREKLDRINPGLGNPAFEVDANLNTEYVGNHYLNKGDLLEILKRIDNRLDLLQSLLDS